MKMLKTELIKKLKEDVSKNGDGHLRRVVLVDLIHGNETKLLSPTRVDKNGQRCYMNQKEMVEYCKENPIKKQRKK